ncbi:MAG: class I SAM-dependent methyltransferase [Verrucomicrobiota bacterium]
MLFNNPISPEKADRLIELLSLSEGDRVVDAGCGRGEFLIRILQRHHVLGHGLDLDPASIEAAREEAARRIPGRDCTFEEADLTKDPLEMNAYALAICIGSTHAFGSADKAWPNTLQMLKHAVDPGGQILVGEGYWKQDPDPDYLTFIGDPVGIYRDHQANITFAEKEFGLTPLYATVSNDDEWDDFEWRHKMAIERRAAEHPEDSEVQKRLKHARAWRDAYLRWGRKTMGFGFYLFQNGSEI